jgi:hypothetical protein
LTVLNKPEQFILALMRVEDGRAKDVTYIRHPSGSEPDFGVNSVNYRIDKLMVKNWIR